ncbi:MAG: D-alanyl-D-alanine carboxypeptidase (penicillin-binding protein 5/6) [Parcubacteria group bacterium Gr01-1014_19]|nr:MAG: D-alanyl-D-alanine carboxypeptidase (penicillin-binding protein 5/6) [Parcubacteria group bacterium Gr01-1014_19]
MRREHNRISLIFTGVVLLVVLLGGAPSRDIPRLGGQEPAPTAIKKIASLEAPRLSLANTIATVKPAILPPSVSSFAAQVSDLRSGETLFQSNASAQWSLASLTKLMTAVVALEKLSEDVSYTASFRAVATEGAAGYLVAGKKYSLSELLRLMLVFSSNDAAVVLAEQYGTDKFISAMNERADSLKMRNTRFFDPSGLSPLNQSSAEDLHKLLAHIFRNFPQIFLISRENIEGATHPFVADPDFLGGKTGFLDEAGGNLVSLFNHVDRSLLIIVLGSKQRAEDTQILKDWFIN